MSTYYVILNKRNQVLAFYGSALPEMAERKLRELEKQFGKGTVKLKIHLGSRPKVYQYIKW